MAAAHRVESVHLSAWPLFWHHPVLWVCFGAWMHKWTIWEVSGAKFAGEARGPVVKAMETVICRDDFTSVACVDDLDIYCLFWSGETLNSSGKNHK